MEAVDTADLSEEEVLQSLPLVVTSTGELATEFGFCALPIDSGARIQLVAVAVIDSKLLVAIPRTAWHKKVAQRTLPQNALQKPAMVEVDAVYLNDRLADPVSSLRIWMGFLEHSLLLNLQEDAEPDTFDYGFVQGDSELLVPTAQALRDAAQEHFAFASAVEFPDQLEEASGLHMGERVGRLESLVEGLASSMATLVSKLDGPVQAGQDTVPLPVASPKRPSAMRNAGAKTPPYLHVSFAEKYPMMDPSVVAAAVQAGVEEDSLREMQKLLGAAAPAAKRLKEPQSRPTSSRSQPTVAAHLSETESEKEMLGGGTPPAPAQTVEQAVTQLAEIVGVLTADKMKKKRASRLEAALDGISASGMSDPLTLGSGKKAAAARRILRSSLQESPEEVYQLIERMMLEDLLHQTVTPGMPSVTLNCRAWMEHRSRIGPYKTGAYLGWTAAGALDVDVGPMCNRSWKLDVGGGAVARTASSSDGAGYSLSAGIEQRRAPILQDSGRPLGGSCTQPPQGGGRLCFKEEPPWKDEPCSRGQARSEGQSKSQGEVLGQSRRSMKLHDFTAAPGPDSRNRGDNNASIPGLRAPTVLVPQLVNSLCRVLLKAGGPLASFVHSVLSRKPNPEISKGPFPRDLWPMAPPYPEAFRSSPIVWWFSHLAEKEDEFTSSHLGLVMVGASYERSF